MRLAASISRYPLESVVVTHAYGQLPFFKFTAVLDSVSDIEGTITLTVGDQEYNVKAQGCDFMSLKDGRLSANIGAIPDAAWVSDLERVRPMSFEDTELKDILAFYGFACGDKFNASTNFINVVHPDYVCVAALANMGNTFGLVDYENHKVVHRNDLIQADPVQPYAGFRMTMQNTPSLGVMSSVPTMNLDAPLNADLYLPGIPTNQSVTLYENLSRNYSELSGLMARTQHCSPPEDYDLGTCMLSPLTMSRCIVVARSLTYTVSGCTRNYWCI